MGFFRSTVCGKDGTPDPGYLAMFWGMVAWLCGNAVILGIALVVAVFKNGVDLPALVQSTGVALGSNAGGFATMLGAVGLFRLGDKDRPNTHTSTATVSDTTAPT